jgi:hypothetical protein
MLYDEFRDGARIGSICPEVAVPEESRDSTVLGPRKYFEVL